MRKKKARTKIAGIPAWAGGATAAIAVLLSLGMAEIFCRVFYQQITTPSGRWAVAIASARSFLRYDDVDPRIGNPRFWPHPYLLYQAAPNYRNEAGVQHNSMGYRDKEFNPEKQKGTVRILALGGSTTYGAGVGRPEWTWPSHLQALLDQDYGAGKYEVINGGLDSACSAEILSGWVFRYRFLHPDIVVLHMGVNDIWPVLLTKDYNPEYVYFRRPAAINQPAGFLRPAIAFSYLVKAYYALSYRDQVETYPYVQARDADLYSSESSRGEVTKRVTETENTGFRRNLDELIKVIKLEGARVLVTTEPALPESEIPRKASDNPSVRWILGLEHAWSVGLQKNSDTMQSVAQSNRVAFFRPNAKEFRYEWFDDWYHLNEAGEAGKARAIETGLKEAGLVSK
jgi:lysophospholipase L1-like esterase